MRLISARIRGYGRLVDTKINLDSKVIAIVGPNEAGKTTLLKALAHVESDVAVAVPQRSRAMEVGDSLTVVSLDFVLDNEDHEALAELELDEAPQSMTVGRKAEGGNVTVGILPVPQKARAPLREASKLLHQSLRARSLGKWVNPETVYGNPESDEARDYKAELTALIHGVDAVVAKQDVDSESELRDTAKSLSEATLDEPGSRSLRDGLSAVVAWFDREEPSAAARNMLWKRTPDLLLFDEADRTIESAYALNDALIADLPDALRNLAGMAGLDLADLFRHVQTGDVARRDTAITQANTRLDAIFAEAWKQSRLSVRFSMDGPLLRVVMWEDGDSITVFDERSAGLRMFVALIAFLKVHGAKRPPVLLIDEAENHLHIDAQADLVNMFLTQDQAVKVVYTTHSPACLPPDLGSGIRSVVPRLDNLQISDVKNSFWQGAAGYSPLMLAMGAAAAAFTPARCVVLAEGATEMILLPTLLRAATGETSLLYQVAPGLSEVPKDFYPQLDLEGAKVAYLLDGDDGGDRLEKDLIKSGIPGKLIVRLDAAGVENVLDGSAYAAAMEALLKECNPGVGVSDLPELADAANGSWSKQLETWIESQGLRAPSKVAIANWLIENKRATPSLAGKKQLRALHRQLSKAMAGGE